MTSRVPASSGVFHAADHGQKSRRPEFGSVAGLIAIVGLAAGCATSSAEPAPLPPPVVTVSQPIVREVADYVDFTGRTEAPYSVDIRPRVTGYLIKMPFQEGSEVKKGDVLFEIDPRPYQAQYDQAKAQVALKDATLKLAVADNARARQLGARGVAAISQQELESYQAKEDQSKAELLSAQATLESNKINLDFTKVVSPIDGRVSRYDLTIGNLVNADQTLLTTVVSENPMYVYFDADEVTFLAVQRRLMAAKVDQLKAKFFPVYMGLADEQGVPHKGYIDFGNNVVSSSTGTITVRGVFENPSSPTGRRLLRPGMFVRVRLPISPLHSALLVSERALGTDQGSKFLYVVDSQNTVQYRPVKIGALQDDGLRVIDEGLKADERVVVSGLQLVRAGMKVEVDEQPMPQTRDRTDENKGMNSPKPMPEPSTASSGTRHAPAKASPSNEGEKADRK